MIFTCLTPRSKCEWSDLRHFVDNYNKAQGTAYKLSKCLDVENRTGKEPEVLLEAPGEIPIVLERKSVVWPANHGREHSTVHYVFDCLFDRLTSQSYGLFTDAAYQLQINDSLEDMTKSEARRIANQIADSVLSKLTKAKSYQGIGGQKPVKWNLSQLEPWEMDEFTPEAGLEIRVMCPMDLLGTQQRPKPGMQRNLSGPCVLRQRNLRNMKVV